MGASRVYVDVEGESFWESFGNRTSRPYTAWKQPILDALIVAGWPADTKLRWSQKAGCSMCPCSPGFYIHGGPLGLDLYATVTADEPQVTNPEEAARRLAQIAADPTMPRVFL